MNNALLSNSRDHGCCLKFKFQRRTGIYTLARLLLGHSHDSPFPLSWAFVGSLSLDGENPMEWEGRGAELVPCLPPRLTPVTVCLWVVEGLDLQQCL